jgi:D-lactate dehydrogenase (cytochrome)
VAAARGVRVLRFGAAAPHEGHVDALAGGICVDMRQMNRVHPQSIDDLDVVMEAGVTRRELDARLRQKECSSRSTSADATIGGMVATGDSGTATVRYGGVRETVLALTLVDATGRIVRIHSRARKSSAGPTARRS